MFSVIEPPRVHHGVNNLPHSERIITSPINLGGAASPTIATPKQSGAHHHHVPRGGVPGLPGSHRGGPSGPSRLSSTAPTTTGFHSSLLSALQEDSDEEEGDYLDWNGGEYEGQMELVTSPSHAASQGGGGSGSGGLGVGFDLGGVKTMNLGGEGVDSGELPVSPTRVDGFKPVSPTARVNPPAAPMTNDIRVMLASGNSTPVEVLRNQVVTSLTLKLKPDWMSKNSMGGMVGVLSS
jgi:hypothetical protein